jgi:hypothetical protein
VCGKRGRWDIIGKLPRNLIDGEFFLLCPILIKCSAATGKMKTKKKKVAMLLALTVIPRCLKALNMIDDRFFFF